MLGDKIQIREEYFTLTDEITVWLKKHWGNRLSSEKLVVGIGGESGSGKSVTAVCLQKSLQKLGVDSCVLHQDDFFFFPPKTNHLKRMSDPAWLGPQEVNIPLLRDHIFRFKNNEPCVESPIIDFHSNMVNSHNIAFNNRQVLIIEGTYTLSIQDLDAAIFINRTYWDTLANRRERKREEITPEIEGFLEREHQIIKQYAKKADLIVDNSYRVRIP